MWQTYQRDGGTFLATRANGDCVYLCAGGCSIYDTRPNICRSYDCRDYATHPGMPLRIRLAAVRRMPMQTIHTPANPCNPCRAKRRKRKKPKRNPSAVPR